MASLIAMLFQILSAKLGIVTGQNLAEMCRAQFPRPVVYAMWGVSEIAAMATDLAEFLGGAIGLSLLLKLPLLAGMVVTGLITYGILLFDRRGFRPLELIIGGLVSVVGLCFLIEMFIAPVAWGQAGLHSVVPSLPNAEALTVAVGIIGATIMPHAVYLHSALTQGRAPGRDVKERRALLRFSNRECIIALAGAGAVNMAMVMMASAAFHAGHSDVAEIQTAYHTLTPLLGAGAAGVFLISLMASGISSSAVGTMAGQVIMQGFVNFRIPIAVRRLVTMVPAFVVIGYGANATNALVISQVVLSFALPLPMIALVLFTRRRDLMGEFVNSRLTNITGDRRHRGDPGTQRRAAAADLRRADPRACPRARNREGSGRFLKKAAQKTFFILGHGRCRATTPMTQHNKVFLLLFVHKKQFFLSLIAPRGANPARRGRWRR